MLRVIQNIASACNVFAGIAAFSIPSATGVTLHGPAKLSFSFVLEVGAQLDGQEWKIEPVFYQYLLLDASDRVILAYHFDPFGRGRVKTPHLHVHQAQAIGPYTFHKAHLPTGIVTLQEFLRMLVTDLGVEPQRTDWKDILEVEDDDNDASSGGQSESTYFPTRPRTF